MESYQIRKTTNNETGKTRIYITGKLASQETYNEIDGYGLNYRQDCFLSHTRGKYTRQFKTITIH
jgi:hypothetical protein